MQNADFRGLQLNFGDEIRGNPHNKSAVIRVQKVVLKLAKVKGGESNAFKEKDRRRREAP